MTRVQKKTHLKRERPKMWGEKNEEAGKVILVRGGGFLKLRASLAGRESSFHGVMGKRTKALRGSQPVRWVGGGRGKSGF